MAYPYVGSYAALDPEMASSYKQVFTGYTLPAGRIGAATSIQTANQISEVEARLKEGIKVIEVQPLQPELFETIPREQFKEINQFAKLANANITMHAPLIDPSGFDKQGWSEQSREQAERHLLEAVERAHDLDPDGNIPVTIHASAIPASEWSTNLGAKPGEELHPKEMMVVVNPETGEISGMRREKFIYPYRQDEKTGEIIPMKKTEVITPEDRLDMSNRSQWRNTLLSVQEMKRHGDEALNIAISQKGLRGLGEAETEIKKTEIYYNDVDLRLKSMYDLAYRRGDESVKKELGKIRDDWVEEVKRRQTGHRDGSYSPLDQQAFYDKIINKFGELERLEGKNGFPIKMLTPVEDFAREHAAKTLSNVAFKAFDKFGENAPIVSVENVIPNMAFSRGEQLAGLIKESRKQFIETAIENNVSEKKAREMAEKLIGATWDVGHINLLRKSGFTEAEIVGEAKKISPYVKHMHLADNFGFEETHLPPGMGNVPMKKVMEQMEKAGFSGKAIVEAGNFAAQFKTSPHPYAIEALGSPFYSAAPGPVWAQARGLYGGAAGQGVMFPEQHFSMYGSGFSALPASLGGQVPGKQSRFSGAPME